MNRQDWYTYKADVLLENLNNEQNQILNKYFSSDSIFKCCIILNIMMKIILHLEISLKHISYV